MAYKFSVGDKVRGKSTSGFRAGVTMTITEIGPLEFDGVEYDYETTGGMWMLESELEKIEDQTGESTPQQEFNAAAVEVMLYGATIARLKAMEEAWQKLTECKEKTLRA